MILSLQTQAMKTLFSIFQVSMDLTTKDLLLKVSLLKEMIAIVVILVVAVAHLPLTHLLVPYHQSVVLVA